MENGNLKVNYSTYAKARPPQPIRLANVDWAGTPEKMEEGSNPQPWHCLPFVEGSTYGLELVYPYETECQVVADKGTIRFEYDFAREPGGGLTGGEFFPFAPFQAAKYYAFKTGLDLHAPPGHVLRTEPHPRFFTDDAGTVPLPMIGHLQNEWYARLVFVVFRAPRPGQRHIFRKGEPFVQILVVPQRMKVDLTPMAPEEAARRRDLANAITTARRQIADHTWLHPDTESFDNHYKVLARAFARGGMAGVEEAVRDGNARHETSLPDTVAKGLEQGARLLQEHSYRAAMEIYIQVLEQNPNCAEALSNAGVCCTVFQQQTKALELMARAVSLEPKVAKYHTNLGEVLRRVGRYQEAEASIRSALNLNPNDPGTMSVFGLILAQQGRTAEGLQVYRAAAALGFSFPGTHVNMGVILAQHNLHKDARACFEAALAIDPAFAPARQALAQLPPDEPS